jgi:Fur family transcriptional regulator, ferric uptake regulator
LLIEPTLTLHNQTQTVLKSLLKAVGLKTTASRLAVLAYFYQQFLKAESTPLSHAELTDRLPQMGLDKVTIYRNLNDLAQANLLLKHSLGDTLWRYSYHHVFCADLLESSSDKHRATNATAHHLHAHPHFVCTHCNQLACLAFQQQEIPAVWSFQIATIEEITVRGICQTCHKASVI